MQAKNLSNKFTSEMPEIYWIDTSSFCNIKCIMCPQHKGLERQKSNMPMNLFKNIIDQVYQNNPVIKLYHSGEPLLNKNIFKMIDYAHQRGCKTMMHTNATLLDEEISNKILDSQLDHISFSFDGCSSEIYEKLRFGASFKKVTTQIEYFLDLKKNRNAKSPYTVIQIIEMKETEKHITAFKNHWKDSGVDEINIQTCMTWIDNVEDFRQKKPEKLAFRPCDHIFKYCSILSDGTVVPCCKDVHGELLLGNINKSSLKKIWSGDEYNNLRKLHLSNTIPKSHLCSGCEDTWVTQKTKPSSPEKY